MTSQNLAELINELEAALPELQKNTVEDIFTQLDSYQEVTLAALQTSISRNLRMAVQSLRAGRAPTPNEIQVTAPTITERFHSGVAIEELILAFRMSFSRIHDLFIKIARSRLTTDELIQGSMVLTAVSDAFTLRAVSTFNKLQVQTAVADASRRASALRTLLSGKTLSREEKAILPLNASERYAVIRAIIPDSRSPETVRAGIERSGSRPGSRAVVVLDDQNSCVGLVAKRPEEQGETVIGIGPFLPISESPLSELVAAESAELSARIGRTGVQGIVELNWRLAANKEQLVDRLFRDRFLKPIEGQGDFSQELIETIRVWLINGRMVSRTAEILHIHQNSVRYRISKFSELTGFDMDDIDDLIGVAWVLEIPGKL